MRLSRTRLTLCSSPKYALYAGCLQIHAVEGELSLVPENRDYIITFSGITDAEVSAALGEKEEGGSRAASVGKDAKGRQEIVLENVSAKEAVTLHLGGRKYADNEVVDRCFKLLDSTEIGMMVKEDAFRMIQAQKDAAQLMGSLLSVELDDDLYGALAEIITA